MWQSLKNTYHLAQSFLANVYYGFPAKKLTIIGVTGTSGKTTTALMIYSMLQAAGYKVSVLTTIKAIIAGKEYDTGFHVTTPDPHVLPKYLKQAVDNGDTHFVLEVSSHALDQNRAAFVPFKIGVLTTLAHEHLDYHKTFINYARAKFKLLFASECSVLPKGLFNNAEIRDLLDDLTKKKKIKTFGLNSGEETQKKWHFKLTMPGEYSLRNALAAATVGDYLGIDKKTITEALENFSAIPGRFEEIPNRRGLRIIIDFAHKPDALEAVLHVARSLVKEKEKVIVLYGCASERDVLKRPIMGKISGLLSDVTVLTDEDPRREDPMKIIDEIAQGCLESGAKEGVILSDSEESNGDLYKVAGDPSSDGNRTQDDKQHIFFKIPNREEAIDFAINTIARKGDIILLCGKGHEQSMNYNGVEKPWSEHKAVEKALNKKDL